MSLEDLSLRTENALDDRILFDRFEAHERVMKNPINGLYTYRVRAEFTFQPGH